MRRADFSRAEYSRRNVVAVFFQICFDFEKSFKEVSGNIFAEYVLRNKALYMPADVRPEMARIILSKFLSGA
jgi:hypothetical protein